MNKTPLTLGYSPCPNDTYIFNALVNRRIESGLDLAEPLLDDVETLNDWAMGGKLDITKVSCPALGLRDGEASPEGFRGSVIRLRFTREPGTAKRAGVKVFAGKEHET